MKLPVLLKEQQIGLVEQSRKGGEGTIKGRRADDKDVTIDLSVQGTQNTGNFQGSCHLGG